jgi:hypothetical protein
LPCGTPLPYPDSVVLAIEGNNLTVFVDSTSNPDDQNKITTLEVKWEGEGPGFVEENCDWDVVFAGDFCCCSTTKIMKVRTRGIGPVFNFGHLIPEGYMETWSPPESWIVDGSYVTGGTLDKFDNNSPYFGPIPEPSSLMLLCIGLLLLRRRP